jgi:hypothetical protein
MPSDDDLVQHAEREVVLAAIAWERERKGRVEEKTSPAAERLKTAVYMLNRAKHITGQVRQDEIERAVREEEEKKR